MNHIIRSVSALLLVLALACPACADGIGGENKAFIKAFNGNKHASELGLFFGKPVSSDARGHKEVTTYRIGLNVFVSFETEKGSPEIEQIKFLGIPDGTSSGAMTIYGGALLLFETLTPTLTPQQRNVTIKELGLDNLDRIAEKPRSAELRDLSYITWIDEDGLWMTVKPD